MRPGSMPRQPSQRGVAGLGDMATSFDDMASQVKGFVGDVDLGTMALYGGLAIGALMLFSALTQHSRTKGRR